jgi:sugar (pentulose or hexulose) kinase
LSRHPAASWYRDTFARADRQAAEREGRDIYDEALLAAVDIGAFQSLEEGVPAMISLGERFEPDAERQRLYAERFERYRALWPLTKDFLRT